MYTTPESSLFRLHHIRPRFKDNCEEVLLFMAEAIVDIGEGPIDIFKEKLRECIRGFPGNSEYSLKTIDNWRTEISSLFALYYEIEDWCYPSALAKDLAENKDLTKFFKYFIHSFQYPGGHLNPKYILELIEKGVAFHPGSFILNLLEFLEKNFGKDQAFLTKAEATACIFNNLRVTTENGSDSSITCTAETIFNNRKNSIVYESKGDSIRYAGDILDYMEMANLLVSYSTNFYLRKSEKRAISRIKKRSADFSYKRNSTPREIKGIKSDWFMYCNIFAEKNIFSTDILAFIAKDEKEYSELEKRTRVIVESDLKSATVSTKKIGDYGEGLVYAHECNFLKSVGKEDIVHLVKCIPNQFAVGYDIQSFDDSGFKKFIEVKTTISTKALVAKKFHLTPNEIESAQTLKDRYFVYRIVVNHENPGNQKATVIQDPIALFKKDQLEINLRTGDVKITGFVGEEIELLA